jgi:hypothetical protein
LGFAGQFHINLPQDEKGVYTVSADTMSGDLTNPFKDRTVHIDHYTGRVLADVVDSQACGEWSLGCTLGARADALVEGWRDRHGAYRPRVSFGRRRDAGCHRVGLCADFAVARAQGGLVLTCG